MCRVEFRLCMIVKFNHHGETRGYTCTLHQVVCSQSCSPTTKQLVTANSSVSQHLFGWTFVLLYCFSLVERQLVHHKVSSINTTECFKALHCYQLRRATSNCCFTFQSNGAGCLNVHTHTYTLKQRDTHIQLYTPLSI